MGKKVEVSYNPQLGYLQTIFHHNFDFLTGIKSYTERTDGVWSLLTCFERGI